MRVLHLHSLGSVFVLLFFILSLLAFSFYIQALQCVFQLVDLKDQSMMVAIRYTLTP